MVHYHVHADKKTIGGGNQAYELAVLISQCPIRSSLVGIKLSDRRYLGGSILGNLLN